MSAPKPAARRRLVPPLVVALLLATAALTTAGRATAAGGSSSITHPDADHAGSGLLRLGRAAGPVPVPSNTATRTLGMDVSSYQGNVDWSSAWNNGARFAYVKATEGTGYVNPYFAQQYNGSRSVGMIRGAYHFALPDRTSGVAQADYFVNHGGGWSADGGTLPPALDIEYNPYGPTCYGLTAAQMVAWLHSFSDEVHARVGRYPVIYSTTDWWTYCTGNDASFAGKNPLWIARYASAPGKLPAGYSTWSVWQYTYAGPFPGDSDVFNGSTDALRQFALAGATTPPTSRPPVPATVGIEGSDGAAYVNRAGSWTSYGGQISGAPAVIGAAAPYGLYLVASTPTGLLYSRTSTTGWSVAAPGNTWCVAPDLTYAGSSLVVACTGSNGAVYTASFDTTRSGNPYFATFTNLGGLVYGGPAVYRDPVTGASVYTAVGNPRDPAGSNLYVRTGSTGWTPLDLACGSHPAAGTRLGRYVYTGCRDSRDNTLHVTVRAPGRTGPVFDGSLGGALVGGVGLAVAADDSAATFFVQGTNGQVYRNTITSGGRATGWASVGGTAVAGIRATWS